ncbi:hypothetical protein NX059_005392 [Plenodomus lindquistii]|nr:hypothetical protein NX059_005392 [Plenodomus lindquistii]
MDVHMTPPYSGPSTPAAACTFNDPCSSPNSSSFKESVPTLNGTATQTNHNPVAAQPSPLTQAKVITDPSLHRLQKDLLVLSSLNENETIHWRPSWFEQAAFGEHFWTLFNPPNVVTELLPQSNRGRKYFTRRIRREGDPPPYFIKSWDSWARYCGMYGVPLNFLCEEHVELLRLGLPRDETGAVCSPPHYPLYPEPQPLGRGRYILDPSTYRTHLPPKFHFVNHDPVMVEEAQIVVVHSNGALTIELRGPFFMHASQWTHFNGCGGYQLDALQSFDETAPKQQGPGRRWSYLPWTEEQEKSCRVELVVKLKVGGVGEGNGDKLLREIGTKR